jgi:hypothetical protein
LQKFNEFCMAVDEDRKSPAGQKFEEELPTKGPRSLHRKINFAREKLVLLPPLLCILMWLAVESSTSSSLASVESSQRAMTSSAATPRPPTRALRAN